MRKYVSELSTEHFKRLLDSLIIHKEDNIKTKFLQFIKMDYPSELVGELKHNSFHVWTYEAGRSGTGPFYPVFDCKFNSMGNRTLVSISTRMNIVGRVILSIICLVLAWTIIAGIIIQDDNSIRYIFWRTIAGSTLFLTFMAVPFFSYRHLRARILEWLMTELKLKKYER